MENRISIDIPQDVTQSVISKLSEIEALLKPFLVTIPEDQKDHLLKIGDKTVPFVTKTEGYTKTAPEFSPNFLNAEELAKDTRALQHLSDMYQHSMQLCKLLEDTKALVNNDAYAGSLLYYHSVKHAANSGIAKAKPIYEDLSQRFPGRPKRMSAEKAVSNS